MGQKIYPTDLARLAEGGLKPRAAVALDTETSGLWRDAGARVSTVSIGWIVADDEVAAWADVLGQEEQHLWDDGIWTLRREPTHGARSSEWPNGDWLGREWVLSMAWPFDQGALGTGKPEDRTGEVVAAGQTGLLEGLWTPDAPEPDSGNLGQAEWDALCGWLAVVGLRETCSHTRIAPWMCAREDMKTHPGTKTGTANFVPTNATGQSDPNRGNVDEPVRGSKPSQHMAASARVVVKPGETTSASTTSMETGPTTVDNYQARRAVVGVTKPTSGSGITGTPAVSKSYARIAIWLKNGAAVRLTCPDCGAPYEGNLTGHNVKFDLHMMDAGTRVWDGLDLLPMFDWDTQGGADLWVGWRTADVGKPTTSLKPNSAWLWGEDEGDEKKVVSTYLKKNKLPTGRWDLMPWRVIAKYADQDARLTARYRRWQEVEQLRVYRSRADEKLAERGWTAGWSKESFKRRMETMRMLARVERRGLPFDSDLAREVGAELDGRIAEVGAKLEEVLGQVTLPVAKHYWFGLGNRIVGPKGQERHVRGLALPDYGKTQGGEPIVDQATLAKMHRDGYPLVDEWMAYKKLTDAKSRWYDGWTNRAGADGRLRTGFRQNGTASGRFSVEEIQLQAIPADYKVKGGPLAGLKTPRDLIGSGVPAGYDLWEMDLAQAELRVAADMAGCRRMLEMIDAGEDLHGYTARELFGVGPDDARWGEYRQVAKRGNFSLIFGVGWETFSATLWKEAGVDWGEQETRSMIQAWNNLYPEFKAAIRRHEQVVMDRYARHGVGWIEDRATGERRWFTKWDIEYFNPRTQRIEKGAHKAFNQRVQPALAQYGIDRWLGEERYLRARAEYEGWDPGAGLVLMVHDSSVLLLPSEVGEGVCADLKAMGEKLWAERFPGLPGGLDISRWDTHA